MDIVKRKASQELKIAGESENTGIVFFIPTMLQGYPDTKMVV